MAVIQTNNFPFTSSNGFHFAEDRHSATRSPEPYSSHLENSVVIADADVLSSETAARSISHNASASSSPKQARKVPSVSNAEHATAPPNHQLGSIVDIGEEKRSAGVESLLMNLNKVQDRADAPRKRQKTASETENDGKSKQKFNNISSSGIVGQYFTDARKQAAEKGDTDMVDLTQDNDDREDDEAIQFISMNRVIPPEADNREVCLGRYDASASIDLIPTPKIGAALQPTNTTWPAIKLTLRRERDVGLVIRLLDPTLRKVGNLDFRSAKAFAPLMDNAGINLRLRARIDSRKKLPGEVAGSPTSQQLKVPILVYAPRRQVIGIGRALYRHSVILKNPSENIGQGIELINPHAPGRAGYMPFPNSSSSFSLVAGQVSRTIEETVHEVQGMLDKLNNHDDLPEKEPDPRILTDMLSHQKQALSFMTEREKDPGVPKQDGEATNSSLWKTRYEANGERRYYNVITGNETSTRPPPVLGGLFADEMGLGKTLSILSLIVDSLNEAQQFAARSPPRTPQLPLVRNSKATLLVAPLSVMWNWEQQIEQHIAPGTLSVYVYHGGGRKQDAAELAKHDIIITSYHTLSSEQRSHGTKKPLALTHWFRIVLDEAHTIRNQTAAIHAATCALSAERRWAVTATPIQNKMDDMGAMIRFLRVKPFEEKGAFGHYIMTPFRNADPTIMPRFRLLLDNLTLRRLKNKINLPRKIDQIVRLEFSAREKAVYEHFLFDSQRKIKAQIAGGRLAGRGYAHVLRSITRLRLLCAHGESLLSEEDMKLMMGVDKDNAIPIEDSEENQPAMTEETAFLMFSIMKESDADNCALCQKKIGERNEDDDDFEVQGNTNTIGHMTACYQLVCPSCMPKFLADVSQVVDANNCMPCPLCKDFVRAMFFELKQNELDDDARAKARVRSNPKLAKQLGYYSGPHTKTLALIESLKESQVWSDANPDEAPIKSVVFSCWTNHLDLIQIALEANNFKYVRLDGTMPRSQRSLSLDRFRSDPSIPIILVSIGAGGLGLNLTTASKVFMMEPQFNPQAEAQAVDRVHRLGQERDVTIQRFIMKGSFEEKMLVLQQKKKDLADMSLSRKMDKKEAQEQKMRELRELFK